jgi:hypothetical protein
MTLSIFSIMRYTNDSYLDLMKIQWNYKIYLYANSDKLWYFPYISIYVFLVILFSENNSLLMSKVL